jgi:hypothetical protein
MMPKGSQEPGNEMMAAVDALVLQLIARVPVYRDAAGAWLVPLHPLLDTVELVPRLETTALTLFHPQVYTLADGTTTLLVPLGEALAVLPFSRHFPEALAQVMRIEAVRTASSFRKI